MISTWYRWWYQRPLEKLRKLRFGRLIHFFLQEGTRTLSQIWSFCHVGVNFELLCTFFQTPKVQKPSKTLFIILGTCWFLRYGIRPSLNVYHNFVVMNKSCFWWYTGDTQNYWRYTQKQKKTHWICWYPGHSECTLVPATALADLEIKSAIPWNETRTFLQNEEEVAWVRASVCQLRDITGDMNWRQGHRGIYILQAVEGLSGVGHSQGRACHQQ